MAIGTPTQQEVWPGAVKRWRPAPARAGGACSGGGLVCQEETRFTERLHHSSPPPTLPDTRSPEGKERYRGREDKRFPAHKTQRQELELPGDPFQAAERGKNADPQTQEEPS